MYSLRLTEDDGVYSSVDQLTMVEDEVHAPMDPPPDICVERMMMVGGDAPMGPATYMWDETMMMNVITMVTKALNMMIITMMTKALIMTVIRMHSTAWNRWNT